MVGTKKPAGRRRTQDYPIQDPHNRQVTFSKRRAGIFKKASELSTLCGVEMALVIFSPSGKAYSFGHPSVDAVLDRFDNSYQPDSDNTSDDEANLRELNKAYSAVHQELAVAKKRGKELQKMARESGYDKSLLARMDELSLEELEELKRMLIDLEEKVAKLQQGLPVEQAAPGPNSAATGDASTSDPEKEISSDVETDNGVGHDD